MIFGYASFIFWYATFIWVYNFYFGIQLLFWYIYMQVLFWFIWVCKYASFIFWCATFILVYNFYLGVQLLFAYINVEQPTERNMSPTQLWMTGEHPRDCDDINSQVYLIELVIFCVLYTQIKVAYQNKSCIPK